MFIRELRELTNYHLRNCRRFAEHDCLNVFKKAQNDLRVFGIESLANKNVLDLGCGQRFPFALQCAAKGAKVTALDLNYVKPGRLWKSLYNTTKHNGAKRAAKSLIRKLFFDQLYYNALEKAAGKPLRSFQSGIAFVVADAECADYPLPPDSFDLIVSNANAVLEHVAHVPRFVAEIKRLLRGGGISMGSFTITIRFPEDTTLNGHIPMHTLPARFPLGIIFEGTNTPPGCF